MSLIIDKNNLIVAKPRIHIIDNLRGVAFIFMIIHHIFYFYDLSKNYETSFANHYLINIFGIIARTIFILLAGYSVYMLYENNKNHTLFKRLERSWKILLHALILTVITFITYPEYYIRFGVLHFIALGTLLISFLAPYKILSAIVLILLIINSKNYPKINNFIDTITGASINYDMLDWFPLNKWLPILLLGLVIAQTFDISKINLNVLSKENFLTYIGKNSLNLYTIHVIILIIFYRLIN